ncbi:MAG: hypothetical protein HYX22_01130 [Candidatus Yanofskybacteria bacterium]|nr:hypothetical protein [Candidatus Yanofskybacteria bacterium]
MAKTKSRVKKMTATEVPFPTNELSNVEKADLATATAAAETTTKDGEASDRLPYPPRTKDGQEAFLALGKSIPSWLWVARARALGHSMAADEVREIIAYDGPEVTCTAPSGQCAYRFQPVRMAHVDPATGALQTDERVVSESNPAGIAYRGAFLAVPVDPKNQHSKLRVLGPLCQRDQRSLSASYKDAGWFVKSFGKAEAEAFVAATNAKKDAGRAAYLARKDENARALGLVTEDGQRVERGGGRFRGNPHMATAGRQGRRNADPRERNIGNRG